MPKGQEVLPYLFYLLLGLAVFSLGLYLVSQSVLGEAAAQAQWRPYGQVFRLGGLLGLFLLSLALSREIGKTFLVQLALSYGLYWGLSYALLLTQNINNIDFSRKAILANGFFELSGWWLVAFLVAGAYLVTWLTKRWPSLASWQQQWQAALPRHLVLSLLMALLVLQDSKLVANLAQFLTLDQGGGSLFLSDLSYKVFLIMGAVTVISLAAWRALDGLLANRASLALALVSSLGLALVLNYTIQYGIKSDTDYLGFFVFPGATLFQILVLALLCFSVYLLVNRYWFASFVLVFTGIAFTLANQTKFLMRSEPVLLTDLGMLDQLDVIFSFVDAKLLVLAVGLLAGLTALAIFLQGRYLRGQIFPGRWIRAGLALAVLLTFTGLYQFFASETPINNIPVLSRLTNSRNIDFEGHARRARYQSLSFVWFKQLAKPIMAEPADYNREAMADLVAKYEKRAQAINKTRTQNLADETIIFILSESLSDPRRIEGVKLSENVLTNIQAIMDKTTSGLMRADNYGGGTANMESQTLLGLPLSNTAAYIYNVEIVPKLALLPAISDSFQSEDKIFIHLGGMQLYSRADVYNRLGFGKVIAVDEKATAPTDNTNYGSFPSDASTYQNILDQLDTSASQFFSVVTYQNHVPWIMAEPASISGTGEGFTDKENERLSHYARLLKKTDSDTQAFLDKLAKVDKPITVVFYGDHLPGLYPESSFKTDPESKYLTDYFIWSNTKHPKQDYPNLRASDFPAAVLGHTNAKVSPYYALLTDVMTHSTVGQTELSPEQQEVMADLTLVQYDLISGKGYLKDNEAFFALPD